MNEGGSKTGEDQAALGRWLLRMDLIKAGERFEAEPLRGGVSSAIWKVTLPCQVICVKQALARLKVQADWRAPVERNGFEAAWMRFAAGVLPDAVPTLHGAADGMLAMAFLPPERYRLWKVELMSGKVDPGVAETVGRLLVRLHGASAHDPALSRAFSTGQLFFDLRLEPYFLATARRHPRLSPALEALAARTAATRLGLVHGDVSPKNILLGETGPVFLDAECAWYGDPAFDLAFCLTHLLLKCLPQPAKRSLLSKSARLMLNAYRSGITWEAKDDLERRAAALLPALALARVDGKSPVEYVTLDADKDLVRQLTAPLVLEPPVRLQDIFDAWAKLLARQADRPSQIHEDMTQ